MGRKVYAYRVRLNNYRKGEETTVISLNDPEDPYVFVNEPSATLFADPNPVVPPDRHYLVGPAVDRLYEYECLGFAPKELAKIIERDKKAVATKVDFHDEDHVWINGRQFISLKRTGEMVKAREEYVRQTIAAEKTEATISRLKELPQEIYSLINDAILKQDRYVSLFYGSSGISIDIYPIVEEEK